MISGNIKTMLNGAQTYVCIYTLWLFNIAMENGPFIDDLPIKNCDFPWYMLNNQRVYIYVLNKTGAKYVCHWEQ
jgi:hypothetical protein